MRVSFQKKTAEQSAPSNRAGATSKKANNNNNNSSHSTHSVEAADTPTDDLEASAYTLFNVTCSPSKPFIATLQIEGADVPMEVDTGASMTLISKATFDKLWSAEMAPTLNPTSSKL